MTTKDLYIGIDPDTDRSGVAVWDARQKMLVLKTLTFVQLFELLNDNQDRIILVRIEAGWLNRKSNWHHRYGQTKTEGEAIARKVGMNQATGIHLCQFCVYFGLLYEEVRPTAHKLNAKMFRAITKYEGRTNQEQRDAAMLIFPLMNKHADDADFTDFHRLKDEQDGQN
jgi:hypothetical protein